MELEQIIEYSEKLKKILLTITEQKSKPVNDGKIMEVTFHLASDLINFLQQKSVVTFDDALLIGQLKNESERFEQERERYEKLSEHYRELGDIIEKSNEIEAKYVALDAQIANIKESVKYGDDKIAQKKEQFRKLEQKLNTWQQTLKEIEDVHEKNVETYKKHFMLNEQILSEISYYKGDSLGHLKEMSEQIQERLTIYDDLLRAIIKDGKSIPIHKLEPEKH